MKQVYTLALCICWAGMERSSLCAQLKKQILYFYRWNNKREWTIGDKKNIAGEVIYIALLIHAAKMRELQTDDDEDNGWTFDLYFYIVI